MPGRIGELQARFAPFGRLGWAGWHILEEDAEVEPPPSVSEMDMAFCRSLAEMASDFTATVDALDDWCSRYKQVRKDGGE